MEPYVFVLDLDGTIIGDCSYQCDLYNLQDIFKKNIKSFNKSTSVSFNKSKMECEKKLSESYNKDSLLIRPHFTNYMHTIKKYYPNSYIFVYTASEKTWANKEIGIIEKQNNIKFNRPIFTRDNCIVDKNGMIKKSIKKIMPQLLKTMKVGKTYDISKKLLIIDNNPTFVDYKDNFLLCPTYNYIKFSNLWDGISGNEYLKCRELKGFLSKMIIQKRMHNMKQISNQEKQERIYKWLYKKHKSINSYNCSYANDTFWRDITLLIRHHNIKEYNKTIIGSIQKSIKN
tara:strand:- start:451 stop:1308 length:858 start_codon:yes stop_codon:yes gene_type:complete